MNGPEAIKYCDENTIGVVAVLGSTFDGSYEPIKEIAAGFDPLNLPKSDPAKMNFGTAGFHAAYGKTEAEAEEQKYLAAKAKASATSEHNQHYLAKFATDGKIPQRSFDTATCRATIEIGERDIVLDMIDEHQAVGLAVLGHVRDAVAHRLGDGADVHLLAVLDPGAAGQGQGEVAVGFLKLVFFVLELLDGGLEFFEFVFFVKTEPS